VLGLLRNVEVAAAIVRVEVVMNIANYSLLFLKFKRVHLSTNRHFVPLLFNLLSRWAFIQ